ncbi:MAG: 2-dehydropantoate 2-reductase [Chloroflexi bacterium]|nr:2-dehydropantoate 2-reductase [Chloroflexota bacterium]
MNIKSIGIIGVGGVGGYFGGKLCDLQKNVCGFSISFVARGEHLRAIQESGLLLSSENDGDLVCRPSLATDDFRRLPRLDLCLVCVKEFDLPAVLSRLEPMIAEEAIVLPLLNGVDVYSRVRTVIKKGIVLSACVYVGTHIERPGKVFQKGGARKILFGPDPLRPDFRPHELVKLFDQAGIKSEWTPDIQVEIWKKFIFICAYGLVSAAYDKTLGEIVEDEVLRRDAQRIMMEAISLAKGSGISLPADIAEASLSTARSFPFETKTSFQRDFARMDKNDERDLFAGAMIRMGRELDIDIPRIRAVSTMLAKRKPAWHTEKPRVVQPEGPVQS